MSLARHALARQWRRLAALCLTLGLLVTHQPPAAADDPATDTPPDPRFGAVEAFWVPEQAAATRLGWERILFYWSEIQPTGPDDWNTLHVDDRWLADAAARGREVVGVLKQTPAWATDGIPSAGVPRGLYAPVDDPANLWANYVRRVAAYYAPRGVHHWVIWNEPDITPDVFGHEFSGSVDDYFRLVQVAHQVMKAVDPQAVIHLAGTTYWHDAVAGRPQYLQRFLEVAAADPDAAANGYYFDVISLHIYFRVETIPQIIAATDAIQAQFGLDKPIWINETNAAPNRDPLWPVERPDFVVDLEQQAWFITQAFALGLATGAERVGVYKFTDVLVPPGEEPFGLLRADLSPRPAYTALQTVIAQLSGFEAVRLASTDAAHVVTFTLPDRTVRVAWARGAATTVALVALGTDARLVDALGGATPMTARDGGYTLALDAARCPDECLIGGPPVYVVEQRVVPTTETAPPPATAAPPLVRTEPPASTVTVGAEPVAPVAVGPTAGAPAPEAAAPQVAAPESAAPEAAATAEEGGNSAESTPTRPWWPAGALLLALFGLALWRWRTRM